MVLLTYKVPPEPAAKRVALWRKLKSMGGIYLQNSACLLPKTYDHLRRLKMLENDALEMGGEAVLLETGPLDRAQEDKVVGRFKADRDEEYREFIDKCAGFEAEIAKETAAEHFTYAKLEENDVDLKKLQGDSRKSESSIPTRRRLAQMRPTGLRAATVFGHVTPDMTIFREEIFGPVLSISPYEDEADAIRQANDTVYGLAGYVQSQDIEAARRVAAQLRVGSVYLNYPDWDTFASFGGYKQSGNGREYADFGIHDFLEIKSVIGFGG